MPRVFALLLMILLLLVASCAGPEVVEVLPTAVAELPTTAATLAPPTSTSTAVPTATELPSATPTELPTIIPTATATATLRPTEIPQTATQTPTVKATQEVPTPSGAVYFLWDPRQHSTTNRELYLSFYRAQFISPHEWVMESMLENLVAPNFIISPDRTKFIFSVYEDTNQSGNIEYYGSSELDSQNLYIYDVVQNNYEQLNTEPSYIFDLSWVGNDKIIHRDLNIFPINGSANYPFTINQEIGTITWLQPSQSGQYIAVHHQNPEPTLTFLEVSTGEIIFEVTNWESYSWVPLKTWSDDETLFVAQGASPNPILVNIAEKTSQILESDGFVVQWLDSKTAILNLKMA